MEGDAPSCRDACTWHGEPKNDTAERDAQRDPDEDAENSKVVVLPRISANAEGKLDEKELENRSISDAEKEEKEVVSKNQLKRRRRFEKALVRNEKRKTLKKETRRAKAIAAGRDLEQEMRIQIERTESGEGRRRRDARWKERLVSSESSFGVCIDCCYENQMTKKEINSLAQQIRYCYAVNKRSSSPSHLYLSSLSGATHQHLSNIEGFSEGRWQSKAFTYSEKSLEDMIPAKDRIVYLTSDSTNVIDELDDSKIYVIGGIVDRNRLTGAAMTRATSLNVATGRLPIKDHLKMSTTKVLTCNHVFEILVKYREYGNDWKKAFLEVIPSRKEVQVIGDESH